MNAPRERIGPRTPRFRPFRIGLEVERWHGEHPEIAEQEIAAPLFGLGLPRTGSTALSFLLAQDPARRPLRGR